MVHHSARSAKNHTGHSMAVTRTFYLITPKGRDLTASAHQLLDDLHRHLTLVDGITLF